MKVVFFIILGFSIFDIALSRGIFDYGYDDSRESSNTGFCTFIAELFGLLFFEDDDDSAEESDVDPAQLPNGPSWLQEIMHPAKPHRPHNEDQEKPSALSDHDGQRPSPPSKPFYPQEQEQEQHEPQPQEQEQVPPILSNNSQSIPIIPPTVAGIPIAAVPSTIPLNDTDTPQDSLIISTPEDSVNDTDGEGIIVGE